MVRSHRVTVRALERALLALALAALAAAPSRPAVAGAMSVTRTAKALPGGGAPALHPSIAVSCSPYTCRPSRMLIVGGGGPTHTSIPVMTRPVTRRAEGAGALPALRAPVARRETISVTGRGFAPYEPVALSFQTSGGAMHATTVTGSTGAFATPTRVVFSGPAARFDLDHGHYVVTATGQRSTAYVSLSFTFVR